MKNLQNKLEATARLLYGRPVAGLNATELHTVVAKTVLSQITPNWEESLRNCRHNRTAYYFSAEFLMGRAVFNNLYCSGMFDTVQEALQQCGASVQDLEEAQDMALGNGGLGRLAACFLDSGATLGLNLFGYGIRYHYGLFRQVLKEGRQIEQPDDWGAQTDPWSIPRPDEAVYVQFKGFSVRALPYDMPIIGYGSNHIGTLRLFEAEPLVPFDFTAFNQSDYDRAVKEKNRAEDICRVLYPNDQTKRGKRLRLMQQYFFASAALQDILRHYTAIYGKDMRALKDYAAIQLNDTHPVLAIPELIRLLKQKGMTFAEALGLAREIFCYTNHTVMPEALERWDMALIRETLPGIAGILTAIDRVLVKEITRMESPQTAEYLRIIQNQQVCMANLAVFVSKRVNGVAELHTDILKKRLFCDFHRLYPQKIQNKTNGITQRRWLLVCNRELTELLGQKLGSYRFLKELTQLRNMRPFADDPELLGQFMQIKTQKKQALAAYIHDREGVDIHSDWLLDVQIKRLHEYKRQLLNILCILELYFEIKNGEYTDWEPTVFLFGAKAAPGYKRAKDIISLIHAVADLILRDEQVRQKLQVLFVSNYNVSYAEKIIPAADISEQISTAGTEASGTGNMKLMLNGAVTLGTYDGANIEIVAEAGEENNYIFGARLEDIRQVEQIYNPKIFYENNPQIRRVLDALTDGTLVSDGRFAELRDSILEGASWHKPDQYYLLLDFADYLETRKRANRDYKDRLAFYRKGWLNLCAAGKFSSDRTIKEYAKDIWKL
ncbi:MAG: glycogen/starch/alpha-glucan family phosphorylase [Clostridia bacterium]|nr:glycogen/starch/alpha-glucan family phosphorylase [Clostridia bacterium]